MIITSKQEDIQLKIIDGVTGAIDIIESSNVYKYLGVKIGRNRIFNLHWKEKLHDLKRKIGYLKAKASSSSNRIWAASILRTYGIILSILYGTKCIEIEKGHLREKRNKSIWEDGFHDYRSQHQDQQ